MRIRFYVVCDFCGTKVFVNESDLFKKDICSCCHNELKTYNWYKEVEPASIMSSSFLKKSFASGIDSNRQNDHTSDSFDLKDCIDRNNRSTASNTAKNNYNSPKPEKPEPPAKEEKKESGCGCGCWFPIMLLILFFVGAYIHDKNLAEERRKAEQIAAERRLQEEKEKAEQEKVRKAELERQMAYRRGIISGYIDEANSKLSQKKWLRSNDYSKAEYWHNLYNQCYLNGISKTDFWNNFGSMIERSFEPPYTKSLPGANWRCPFSISTSDADSMYFVKLTEIKSGKVQNIFFYGKYFKTTVPPGNYTFKYGCGEKWYGPVFLFGPGGSYHKSNDVLKFYNNGRQLCGHTIELIRQRNGNFDTQTINESDF